MKKIFLLVLLFQVQTLFAYYGQGTCIITDIYFDNARGIFVDPEEIKDISKKYYIEAKSVEECVETALVLSEGDLKLDDVVIPKLTAKLPTYRFKFGVNWEFVTGHNLFEAHANSKSGSFFK